ncbi:MAG: ATP-binding protein [Candidatus Micrarchaeota archaeon]
MEFVDREKELAELRELLALSKKKLFVVALYGLRRAGKTRLLTEFLKGGGLYFFVNKNKTSADLLQEFQEILRAGRVLGELEAVGSWDKFVETAITRGAPPMVFDEFQNFQSVEPAIFGILQKNIDINEDKPGLVILSGSLIGLVKKTFQDSKEPLYGRIKKGIKLEPLKLEHCLKLAGGLKLSREDAVKLYGIFGGFPKYYVAIEDYALEGKTAEEIVEALLLAKDAPLEDEVSGILSQEFGGRSGVYYSILEAIAAGNNSLSAIAGCLNAPATSITRQVSELRDYFELIEFERPYAGKRGAYRIKHPLMRYWFSEIYRRYSDYATRRPEFVDGLKSGLNAYFGRAFETAAKEFLEKELGLTQAGRQWGKLAGAEKGQEAYEIDLVGKSRERAFAFEFKFTDLGEKQALATIESLKQKATRAPGLPDNLTFGVVAKKIAGKASLRAQGFLAFDLDDF